MSQANFAHLRQRMDSEQVLYFRMLAAIIPASGDGLSYTGGLFVQIPDASKSGERQVFLLNGFLKHSKPAAGQTALDRMKNVFNGAIFALVTLVRSMSLYL
jgi:hypothetical protein